MACRAKRSGDQSQCWLYSKFKARLIHSCSQNDNKKINKSYILYTKLFLTIINRICNVKSYFWAKNHHSFFVKNKIYTYNFVCVCFYTISRIDSSYQITISYMILFHDLMFSLTVFCVCLNTSALGCVYVDIYACSCVCRCAHTCRCACMCACAVGARSHLMVVFSTPTLCFEIESHYDLGLTDYASLVG